MRGHAVRLLIAAGVVGMVMIPLTYWCWGQYNSNGNECGGNVSLWDTPDGLVVAKHRPSDGVLAACLAGKLT